MILLTGGSGFIGSHFLENFEQSEILIFDKKNPNFKTSSSCIIGDIRNKEDFEQLRKYKISRIIHLAAVHFDFQTDFYKTNVDGTQNIIEFAKQNKINDITFYSSVAVYGEHDHEVSEEDEPTPNSDYGKSKLMAEKILVKWANENTKNKLLIIRPTVVFGERNFGNVFNLITQIKSKFFFQIGYKSNIKSIAYVKNLVVATENANKFENGIRLYNYVDYAQCTTFELTKIISGFYNVKKTIRIPLFIAFILAIPFDILGFILQKDIKISTMRVLKYNKPTYFNADKIKEVVKKQPYDIHDALRRTAQWIDSINHKEEKKEWKKQFLK